MYAKADELRGKNVEAAPILWHPKIQVLTLGRGYYLKNIPLAIQHISTLMPIHLIFIFIIWKTSTYPEVYQVKFQKLQDF